MFLESSLKLKPKNLEKYVYGFVIFSNWRIYKCMILSAFYAIITSSILRKVVGRIIILKFENIIMAIVFPVAF